MFSFDETTLYWYGTPRIHLIRKYRSESTFWTIYKSKNNIMDLTTPEGNFKIESNDSYKRYVVWGSGSNQVRSNQLEDNFTFEVFTIEQAINYLKTQGRSYVEPRR